MFTRSHLQEMKRRYASMYAPLIEEKFEEHCGVCGEQGIEEVEIGENLASQGKKALEKAGIKVRQKDTDLYVTKKDKKKASDILIKTIRRDAWFSDDAPMLKTEEVELDEGKFKKGDIVIPNMGPHKGDKHEIIHDFGDGSYNIKPLMHPRNIKYKLGASKAKENQLKLVKEEVELDEKGTAYPATVDTLRKIVKDKQHQTVMFKSGKAIVDLFTASAMVQVYDALKKPDMKKTFEKMITDKAGFMKTQAFAMKMIGK